MRASRRGAALGALLALVCLLPAAAPAGAEELLVMPYVCEMRGGRPRLTPGPERGYRIIGAREERTFNACSPANPGMCRRWTVYRFDIDCSGERVPWVELVAAANESGRRARLVDGRLEVRMPPRWSLPRHDPCVTGNDPFGDQPGRRCADRLGRASPAVVEMPSGFAPMLGIDAIFVRATPRIAKMPPSEPPPEDVEAGAEQSIPNNEQPPSEPAGGATANRTPPPPTPPPPPPAPPKGVQEANSKAPPPAPPQPPPTKDQAPPRDVAAPSPPPANPPLKGPPPSNSPPPSKAATPPPPAKQPSPPPQEVATERPPPKASPPPETRPPAKVAVAPPAPKREVAPQPPPPKREVGRQPPPAEAPPQDEATQPAPSLFSFRDLRTPAVGFIVAFTGLTLGILVAFAAARRRERPQPATGNRQRTRATPRLGFDDGNGSPPPQREDSPLDRVAGASAADAALAALGERVPQTRKEAFELLAAGLGRRADLAAIKKIVDALRRAWYPDWAKDEADRQVRELRSKQINAAWDLLQSERTDA